MDQALNTVSRFSDIAVIAIVAGCFLIVGLLILAIGRGWINPSITKNGFIARREPELQYSVPRVDSQYRLKEWSYITESAKQFLVMLHGKPLSRLQKLLVRDQVLAVLHERIERNHLTTRLTTGDGVKQWTAFVSNEIIKNILYIVDYVNEDKDKDARDYISGQDFGNIVGDYLKDVVRDLQDFQTDAIKEKLSIYEQMADCERKDGLIAKNQGYLTNLEALRRA
jgi:hypothetical protein